MGPEAVGDDEVRGSGAGGPGVAQGETPGSVYAGGAQPPPSRPATRVTAPQGFGPGPARALDAGSPTLGPLVRSPPAELAETPKDLTLGVPTLGVVGGAAGGTAALVGTLSFALQLPRNGALDLVLQPLCPPLLLALGVRCRARGRVSSGEERVSSGFASRCRPRIQS